MAATISKPTRPATAIRSILRKRPMLCVSCGIDQKHSKLPHRDRQTAYLASGPRRWEQGRRPGVSDKASSPVRATRTPPGGAPALLVCWRRLLLAEPEVAVQGPDGHAAG